MLAEGTDAPTFTLPGVVDGAPRDVDLADYVGNGILVLAFYPADFNPACEDESCDLTELDLFTMQQDVDVFAVSPDSVFSHRTFAEEYSLSIPLLADTHGEAMDAYDVRYEASDQLLAERAVFVIDQRGVLQYAWSTTDLEERPPVDEVREAVSSVGGDSTAVGRYRVGHAHYMEGRRAFTSAMGNFQAQDWLMAQGDFQRAMEEFQESADQFQSAVRFAESDPLEEGFERAQQKATALWQAAEWLAESASEYASGNGEEADALRRDAEAPLETAQDIGKPPHPDDFSLDAEAASDATADGDDDLDAPADPADDEPDATPGGQAAADTRTDEEVDAAVQDVEVDGDDADAAGSATTSEGHADDPTVGADGGPEREADVSDSPEADESGADDADDADGDDVELDLKDPTE